MINILRDGYKQKPTIRVYTLTCPDCGCIFECDYSDFKWQSRGIVLDAGVLCPYCNHELHVGPETPCRVEFKKEAE